MSDDLTYGAARDVADVLMSHPRVTLEHLTGALINAMTRIAVLESDLARAEEAIAKLSDIERKPTAEAAQREADQALADLNASGYGEGYGLSHGDLEEKEEYPC